MEPVRVKVYGLVSMTRRRYLAQLIVAGLLDAGLLAFWYFRWPAVRASVAAVEEPVARLFVGFWDAAPWVAGALAVLLLVEAFFVLRQFARREAERKPLVTGSAPSSAPGSADSTRGYH